MVAAVDAKGDSQAAVDKCSKKLPHGTTEDRTEHNNNREVHIEGNCRIRGKASNAEVRTVLNCSNNGVYRRVVAGGED